MNAILVEAIRATGAGSDGQITTSDVYALNQWIRGHRLAAWTAFHGDDEGNVETGFHRVQGDGSDFRLFGEAGVDTVLDGLYHAGFEIRDGRFVNEDGNANATVDDVAFWLNTLLKDDLAAGRLANPAVDPQIHGTTGTGLDALVEAIVDDAGLNDTLSQAQINKGAEAADGMNRLLVEAIRATGVADDGDIDGTDVRDVNAYIQARHLAEWTALHGDDENGVETGFHLVQGDGGRGYLFGEETVDTVADGLYHAGFDIQWGHFVNEDGNGNAAVDQVADWLTLLLQDDLASGALASGRSPADPAAFAADIAWRRAATVSDNGDSGAFDAGNPAALQLRSGTIAFAFTANAPDDGGYHVLFSKDGATAGAGDLTAFVHDGRLAVLLQDAKGDHWIEVEDHLVEAGRTYDFALSFGTQGLSLYLDGEKLATDSDLTTGLNANSRGLVIGGGTWGRSSADPRAIWNHLDGTVENFTVYDRALTRFEVAGLATHGALGEIAPGAPARSGALPAALAGSGLSGEVFDRTGSFASIDDLIAQTTTQASPNFRFDAHTVAFGGFGESKTLGAFLGTAGQLTGSGANAAMTTIGIHLTGFVYLEAGDHLLTVRSDDGFLLKLGGEVISSYAWDRGFDTTSRQVSVSGGLYAVDLYYFQNSGADGLSFEIDGKTAGAELFYKSIADYDAALAAHGAMPSGGLTPVYDGPEGTTGTGLDALIRIIGTDEGLAHNVSAAHIAEAAHAADTINGFIVEAIRATGAANDGVISAAETAALSDYIRTYHYDAFVAAHGDDENGVETAFHLIQGDGGTTFLYGEDAINTVLDGLYHIGFSTTGDRFANEDGNPNAKIETVAFWINQTLQNDLTAGTLKNTDVQPEPATGPVGSAAQPDVIADSAGNTVLAVGARTLTLVGAARNGMGNSLANRIAGNGLDNLLDGGDGNDTIIGGAGRDILIGGNGTDRLEGGSGDDTYYVGDDLDRIVEGTGGGHDEVRALGQVRTYRLGADVEDLTYMGAGPFTGFGNASANRLAASTGADRLYGEGGNDTLDGGKGADTLCGGTGNDVYYVDSTGDVVAEAADQGNDIVYSSVSRGLGSNIEQLVLTGMARLNGTGNALANVLTGNDANNTLSGLDGDDTLRGGDGNDYLQGGNGADNLGGGRGFDRLAGGAGNDTYVGPTGDLIIEDANGGTDSVESATTFSLDGIANVENLILVGSASIDGTGNALANRIMGNAGSNALAGGDGRDTLDGGDGNDTLAGGGNVDQLTGGRGNDIYVDPDGDSIVETADGGVDTVRSAGTFSLAALNNVERIELTGLAGVSATGNNFANKLTGNDAGNFLIGAGGDDTLVGNGGSDTLLGGLGRDVITAGDGADRVRFGAVAESTGAACDVLYGLDFGGNGSGGVDRLGFTQTPSAIRLAITSGVLRSATFDADLASAVTASRLGAGQAILFDPSSGDRAEAGHVYLIVDANGVAGYQAGQDFVVELVSPTGTIDLSDFL